MKKSKCGMMDLSLEVWPFFFKKYLLGFEVEGWWTKIQT